MENQNPQNENLNPSTTTVSRSPQTTQTPPPVEKPKPKVSLGAIIGIIIFLLFAGGAAASFTIFRPQIIKLVSKPTPTPTISVQISPTPTPDPTTDWKTFTNSKYDFELKYPIDWDVKENTDYGFVMFTPPGADFFAKNNNDDPIGSGKFPSIYANVLNTTFEETLQEMANPNRCVDGKETILTSDNTKALYCNEPGAPFSNIVIDLPINNGTKTLEFSLFYFLKDRFVVFNKEHHSNVKPATIQDFKQILSTFKFTDTTSVNTTEWKSYTSKDKKYTFKYPPNLDLHESNDPTIPRNISDGEIDLDAFPGLTDGNCISIRISVLNLSSSNIKPWIEENRKLTKSGTGDIIPTRYSNYSNSIDKTITGFWIEFGSEAILKSIFIPKKNKYVEFVSGACAAGDSYQYHQDTEQLIENMIPTFKFTN